VRRLLFYLTLVLVLILGACAQPPQPIEPENPGDLSATAFGGTGLTGVYFDNIDFTGTQKTRVDATINRVASTAAPITGIATTSYSIRWTGQVVPAFSEEYTFYLTHTDGARLMVNGQVLVNNWKDQAQVVDSGKVTLQAGVKYDIRLEYYRNATNPGLVKLEWQSVRRTRQVVPADNLFATGSNLESALTILRQEPKFIALAVTLNNASTVGSVYPSGFSLSVSETNGQAVVYSIVNLSTSKVTSLMRHSLLNGQVTSTNVLSGRSVSIDNFKSYFNPDGTITDANLKILKYKFAALLLDQTMIDALKQYDVPAGSLQTQAVGPAGYCADCQNQVANLVAALGEFNFGVTTQIALGLPGAIEDGLNPPKTFKDVLIFLADKLACDKIQACSVVRDAISKDALGLAGTLAEKYTDGVSDSITKSGGLADLVKQCVFQSQNCKPEIVGQNVIPSNPRIKINESVDLSLGFANKASAKWGLEYTVTISNITGGVNFQILSGGSGALNPGQKATVQIKATCPNYGTNGSATAVITNTTTGQVVNVALSVFCGAPKISDLTPNPLEIVGQAGQTVSRNISFSNIGDGILTYSTNLGFFNSSLNVRITSGGTGNVQPGQNANVTVTITCPNQSVTDSGSIYINSNDPIRPTVGGTVTIECIQGSVSIVKFGAATRTRNPIIKVGTCPDQNVDFDMEQYGTWSAYYIPSYTSPEEFIGSVPFTKCAQKLPSFDTSFKLQIETWLRSSMQKSFNKFLSLVPATERGQYVKPYIDNQSSYADYYVYRIIK
jgi:PA14 domain